MAHDDEVRVRPARPDDEALLLRWANDPITRRMSFNSEEISPETHAAWFEAILSARTGWQLVAETRQGRPLGQVRFDSDGQVSLALDPDYRGQGLAAPTLRAALAWARRELKLTSAVARIKPENVPSIRAFERVGFRLVRWAMVRGQPCLEYDISLEQPPGRQIAAGTEKNRG